MVNPQARMQTFEKRGANFRYFTQGGTSTVFRGKYIFQSAFVAYAEEQNGIIFYAKRNSARTVAFRWAKVWNVCWPNVV